MPKFIARLMCRFGYHKFGAWERAEFKYDIPGRSRVYTHFGDVRDCEHCKFMDEKPDGVRLWQWSKPSAQASCVQRLLF